MEEVHALDHLNGIEIPPSVQRVLRFLDEYSFWLDSVDEDRAAAAGTIGLQSIRFASQIAGKQEASGLMMQSLKVRHGVFAQEIREFVFWLKGIVSPTGIWAGRTQELELLAKPSDLGGASSARRVRTDLDSEPKQETEIIDLTEEFSSVRPGHKVRLKRHLRSAPDDVMVDLIDDRPDVARTVVRKSGWRFWPSMLGAGSFAFGGTIANGLYNHSSLSMVHGFARGPGGHMHFPPPTVGIEQSATFPDSFATRAALARGMSQHQAAGYPRVPSRDLISGVPGPLDATKSPVVKTPGSLPFSPLLGQLTLVTPPLRVADPKVPGKAGEVAFDLRAMAKGAGQLTPDNLRALKEALPPGTQALYPALPLDSIGPSAVNVPLAAETIDMLVDKGYGKSDPGWAGSVAALAWSTPAAGALIGSMNPAAHAGIAASAFNLLIPGLSATDQRMPAATRGGIMDFLGLPVHLAPSPDGPHELHHRQVGRTDMRAMPTISLKPNIFASIQRQAFPHFQTITAKPQPASTQSGGAGRAGVGHSPQFSPIARSSTPRLGGHAHSPIHAGTHTAGLAPKHAPIATRSMVGLDAGGPPHGKRTALGHTPQAKHVVPHSDRKAGPTSPPKLVSKQRMQMPAIMPSPHLPHAPDLGMKHPALPHGLHDMADHAPAHIDVHEPLHVDQSALHHPAAAVHKPELHPANLVIKANAKPDMPLAAKQPPHHEDKHLAVQASTGNAPEPAEKPAASKTSGGHGAGQGGKDAEIGLLANEVWSLLKRRLAFEAQRAGHS